MADVTAKLAEALREIAAAHIPDMPAAFNDPVGWRERQFRNLKRIAREALAAYEQAQAEPVAWRVWRGDSYELFFNEEAAKRRCECFIRQGKPEPLFAAPVAQAEFICRKCGLRQEGEMHEPNF